MMLKSRVLMVPNSLFTWYWPEATTLPASTMKVTMTGSRYIRTTEETRPPTEVSTVLPISRIPPVVLARPTPARMT